MIRLIATIVFVSVLMISGCQSGHNHKHADKEATSLQLNNGRKWTANPETTAGIESMLATIATLPATPNTAECGVLKDSLDTQFNRIIEQCTMTGEAHEQLHHYLMPLAKSIKELKSSNVESCRKHATDIQSTLSKYTEYFN